MDRLGSCPDISPQKRIYAAADAAPDHHSLLEQREKRGNQ
jgi:hypothetical protein